MCTRASSLIVKFFGIAWYCISAVLVLVSCLSFTALPLWKYFLSSEACKEVFALLFIKKTSSVSHCVSFFGAWSAYDEYDEIWDFDYSLILRSLSALMQISVIKDFKLFMVLYFKCLPENSARLLLLLNKFVRGVLCNMCGVHD